jgi:hypothetical protein
LGGGVLGDWVGPGCSGGVVGGVACCRAIFLWTRLISLSSSFAVRWSCRFCAGDREGLLVAVRVMEGDVLALLGFVRAAVGEGDSLVLKVGVCARSGSSAAGLDFCLLGDLKELVMLQQKIDWLYSLLLVELLLLCCCCGCISCRCSVIHVRHRWTCSHMLVLCVPNFVFLPSWNFFARPILRDRHGDFAKLTGTRTLYGRAQATFA